MKIITLDEYVRLNEDFYNPFEEEKKKKQKSVHIADSGGSFEKRKEHFNLARVEWTKRPGGDYTVIAKTQFARGEIIEICPMIILSDISKTVDRLKEIVFEIDKKKGEYALVLGYGSLYRHSPESNVDYAYNKRQRHMFFIANRTIQAREELTINYGSDYWEERSNLNTMGEVDNISAGKGSGEISNNGPEIEESEVQPSASDIRNRATSAQFNNPKSRGNPSVSGVTIKGLGQQ
jgi:hypothetical protein